MTISNDTRTAGPFIGNGVTTAFPFTFKVFTTADILAVQQDTDGNETNLVLSTHYTVTLNPDQDVSEGGVVTMLSPLTDDYTLTLTSNIGNLQGVRITNLGGFYPKVINTALDRVTILIQQLANKVNRSVKIPLSDGTSVSTELPTAALRANKTLVFDASGNLDVSLDDYTDNAAEAAASAIESATSATAASNSATTAAISATAASNSAIAAATSNTASSNSATASAASASAAAASAALAHGVLTGTTGGSANAYTLTTTATITSLVAGQVFAFVANHLSTSTATLNINAIGAKTIKVEGLYDLPAYAIKNGQLVTVYYDGTYMQPLHMWSVTGDILHTSTSTKPGYLRLDGVITIGSTASGANNASASMEGMYRHIWDNYDNTEAAVSGGARGADAATDFAANRTLTLPNFKDKSIYGIGSTLTKAGKTSGAATVAGAGTIVVTMNATTLSTSQLPALTYTTQIGSADDTKTTHFTRGSGSNLTTTTTPISTNAGGGSFTPTGTAAHTGSATSVLHPVVGLYPLMKI